MINNFYVQDLSHIGVMQTFNFSLSQILQQSSQQGEMSMAAIFCRCPCCAIHEKDPEEAHTSSLFASGPVKERWVQSWTGR